MQTRCQVCFPVKNITPKRTGIHWLNTRLHSMRSQLRNLRNRFKFTKSECYWTLFTQHIANYRRALKEEKFKYYDGVVISSDNKNKVIWKTGKRELSNKNQYFITSLSTQDFNVFFFTICETITSDISDI